MPAKITHQSTLLVISHILQYCNTYDSVLTMNDKLASFQSF